MPASIHVEGLWGFQLNERYSRTLRTGPVTTAKPSDFQIAREWNDDTEARLAGGHVVVLFPSLGRPAHTTEVLHCTDLWCYPMLHSTSESMSGTMGLLADNEFPVLRLFSSETYSTYPWWSILSNPRSVILDNTPMGLVPIVQTIGNFEQNHKLGLLWECRVLQGKLLVCTVDPDQLAETTEGMLLLAGIFRYAASNAFQPDVILSTANIRRMLL